jgi:putative Mg2+ transporter-C (MgtC) family protein
MDQALLELRALLPIVASAALSGVIGWERDSRDRPAGLRTHILVGIGATLFVIIGQIFVARTTSSEVVRMDPIRITEAIIAGVSFIGAGTVIVRKKNVAGLTTAASLFAVAGVGIACGLRLFVLAAATTLLIFGVLRFLYAVERRMGLNGDEA